MLTGCLLLGFIYLRASPIYEYMCVIEYNAHI